MSRNAAFPRHRLHLVSRGPGGPFERADYEWARECRKAGWSLKVIASYFEPQPSSAVLRRVLKEKTAVSGESDSVAARLQAVLAKVDRETKHAPACDTHNSGPREYGKWYVGDCTCDREPRVWAEVARRWAASLESACSVGFEYADGSYFPDKRSRTQQLEAALAAAQKETT